MQTSQTNHADETSYDKCIQLRLCEETSLFQMFQQLSFILQMLNVARQNFPAAVARFSKSEIIDIYESYFIINLG